MTELQKQFQEEKGISFEGIPINGVHLEYITWLESQIQALRIHDVVGRSEQLKCGNSNPPCSPNVKFGCLECTECNWSE